jgi:hypothetical protein
MPIFIDEAKAAQEPKFAPETKFVTETKFVPETKFVTEARFVTEPKPVDDVRALVQLLRNRSYAEIRQRMYDSAPGSPWWSACRAELELRNGQQVAEASLAMSRVSEKMHSSVQHFEQLADTLQESTNGIADLLRGTQEAARRLEIAVYVIIGVTLVQFFNLVFEVFRKH